MRGLMRDYIMRKASEDGPTRNVIRWIIVRGRVVPKQQGYFLWTVVRICFPECVGVDPESLHIMRVIKFVLGIGTRPWSPQSHTA
jgi:hypothetical protein